MNHQAPRFSLKPEGRLERHSRNLAPCAFRTLRPAGRLEPSEAKGDLEAAKPRLATCNLKLNKS